MGTTAHMAKNQWVRIVTLFLCHPIARSLGLLAMGIFLSNCGQVSESCFGFSQKQRPKDFSLIYTLPVKFSNCSPEGDSFYWDFGDGSSSQEKNPEHLFRAPGQYTVILKTRTKHKEDQSSTTLMLIEPSASDSLTKSWRLTGLTEYILNQNYPIDSSVVGYSATIWKFLREGILHISGFPQTTSESWMIVERKLVTDHKHYQILNLENNQLILESTDTLYNSHPGIKALIKRKLVFESFQD
jgi:hypothetical protein